MARRISSRLRICGTLRTETPLHIGGYGVDVDTDLPLARNGKNQLYVPGTSIAGVLRAWCEGNFDEDEIGEIFGPKREKGIEKGHASFVLIEDAVVITKKIVEGKEVDFPILTEIRDGVGIDRFYGTAADGAKYDRAILPKGSKLGFEMTVEIQDRKKEDKKKNIKEETPEQFEKRIKETKAIIGHLLSALENEEIRFGASKTRGLGRVKLDDCKVKEEKFTGVDDKTKIANILKFFDGEDDSKQLPDWLKSEKIEKFDSKPPKLDITIEWSPRLPLMVKAGYEGIGVDMLPVTSGVADGKLSLVLAGSSIKGALRSQAERIVRTLKDLSAKDKNFNDQIDGIPFVEELFGARKKAESKNVKLGLGALSIDDCYSVESFNQDEWRKVETAKVTKTDNGKEVEVSYSEQELWQAIETVHSKMTHQTKIQNPHFHITHHTAIDRFTGGVADGALYSVLAPHNIEWKPIKMSLDFGRTDGKDKCCLMLLLLVLRDLAENRLPLGFATNRGMGEIEVENIKLEGKNLTQIGLPKDLDIPLTNGDVRRIDKEIKDSLKGDWDEWLKK